MASRIACRLDPAGLARRQELLADLIARADDRRELAGGYVFVFRGAAVTLPELAAVVEAERRCCWFLRSVIGVESEGGPVTLELDGPDGTKEFLRGLLPV